jgi:chromosome segregation ATPase
MKLRFCIYFTSLIAFSVMAQVPSPSSNVTIEDRSGEVINLQQQQRRVSAAYEQMKKAQYEGRMATQEFQNAQENFLITQKKADDLKAELEKLTARREAAEQKRVAAEKEYDTQLNAIPTR